MKKLLFGNIYITNTRKDKFLMEFQNNILSGIQFNVNFLNAHCYNVAQKDQDYLKILNESTYLLNDGIGLKVGGKLLSIDFYENMNGTDLMPLVLNLCSEKGFSVYILGASNNNNNCAVANLNKDYPELIIKGNSDGYFNDESELIKEINTSQADVLIVGMGVPLQEKFISRNQNMLTCKASFCTGAFIDFLSGNITRAPKFMRKAGLEWLYRLILEPGRLWKRYILGNFSFIIHILKVKIVGR